MASKLYMSNCSYSTGSTTTIHPRFSNVLLLPPLNFTGFNVSRSRLVRTSVIRSVVKDEQVQTSKGIEELDSEITPTSSKLVLVIGGTGGVGQLLVASLLSRNIKSRLLLRDPPKAKTLFGEQDENILQVLKADTRNPGDLDPAMFEGVTHVICCTGTTAFPSKRWDGDNTPERVDWEGVRNLVSALPSTVKRFVLVSSVGVTKSNELPWSIMNLFGVLKFKKMGEDFVRSSNLPFTIIRPGRLTDGPYTSYDLNTLLKATAGQRRAVLIGQGSEQEQCDSSVEAELKAIKLSLKIAKENWYKNILVVSDSLTCINAINKERNYVQWNLRRLANSIAQEAAAFSYCRFIFAPRNYISAAH